MKLKAYVGRGKIDGIAHKG